MIRIATFRDSQRGVRGTRYAVLGTIKERAAHPEFD
jgi:hypothetical protein